MLRSYKNPRLASLPRRGVGGRMCESKSRKSYLQSGSRAFPFFSRTASHKEQKNKIKNKMNIKKKSHASFFQYYTVAAKVRTCFCLILFPVRATFLKVKDFQWKEGLYPFLCLRTPPLSVFCVTPRECWGRANLQARHGMSVTGRFCFKVSIRERTPRFTLVVTRLVMESAGGGGGGRTF